MKKIIIKNSVITQEQYDYYKSLCPFNAFFLNEKMELEINEACRMCKQCVKKDLYSRLEYLETTEDAIDKSLYKGIYVFVEIYNGKIKDVSLELISKAYELSQIEKESVNAIVLGKYDESIYEEILQYKVNHLYVYEYEDLNQFNIEIYTNILDQFLQFKKPSILMFGGTNLARSLAPRLASRSKTGLTADCTKLEIKNSDLIQIRPAFGGNIMASIKTKNNRPQMCTVRSKIFSKMPKSPIIGKKENLYLEDLNILYDTKIIPIKKEEISLDNDISEAERIVVIGRIFNEKNIEIAKRFAKALSCSLACTRPVVESGLLDSKKQIGLSGRTVSPKLLITLGVSGSVQFTAGLANIENIISINHDPNATIFSMSNYCIHGDVFKVLNEFMKLFERGSVSHVQKVTG